jgi:predicted transcriptional regulator
MTAATTLKLPEALKSRITELAKSAGKTQYVFVVAALTAQVQRSESRRDFVGAALRGRR